VAEAKLVSAVKKLELPKINPIERPVSGSSRKGETMFERDNDEAFLMFSGINGAKNQQQQRPEISLNEISEALP
jgi:hypothetical protein